MPNVDQNGLVPRYRGLAEIARRFPSNREDKQVHIATLTRWILKGCRASDGSQIKLRAVRFPAGWRTTDEWVSDFLDEITRDRHGVLDARTNLIHASAQRRREIERADRECKAAGLCDDPRSAGRRWPKRPRVEGADS
jgi:hypothetical protein